MFSGFFGKGDNSDKKPPKDAADSRGLVVVEDDPDTAWSLWDSALAEQDSRFSADALDSLPPISENPIEAARHEVIVKAPPAPPAPVTTVDLEVPTQPLALEEKTLAQRKEDALAVVDLHHHRIANTIRNMWGYKECAMYLNKLIMDGGDGMGHARIGFNQEAVQAMLVLVDLHEKEFPQLGSGVGLSLDDPTQGGFGSRKR